MTAVETDPAPPALITPGAAVRARLAIFLPDGTEAFGSGGEPLAFTLGDGTLSPGLEALLLGLAEGSDTQILVHGRDVFGARDPARVHTLDPADLPEGFRASPGDVLAFATPAGQETTGTVLSWSGEGLTVDFNHPLSAWPLRVVVSVLAVEGGERQSAANGAGRSV